MRRHHTIGSMALYTVRVEFDDEQTTLFGTKVADMRTVSKDNVRDEILDRMGDVLPGSRAQIPARERASIERIITRSSGNVSGYKFTKPTVLVEVATAEGVSEKLMKAVRRAAEMEVGMDAARTKVMVEDDSFSFP